MRKHGWQLPYHPLQVVAVAVFLALGFAFYVFFAPFVGRKLFQYAAMGLYTPLIVSVFGLYIWCAAADPADPGVFKSKKYLKVNDDKKQIKHIQSKLGGEMTSSIQDAIAETDDSKAFDKSGKDMKIKVSNPADNAEKETTSSQTGNLARFVFLPYACLSKCSRTDEESSDQHTSEDGMFYCSLCEVEVLKYSKHCRVCDKCVDRFDHHCRWLNNCIGKRNYRKFFTLMVSAILLLVLQWSIGILVLICCFVEKKKFKSDISTKLGSSFTMVPFVIIVSFCTILAMIATLPLAQLFFFHILLIKKGISTYDYIIALREQEQGNGGGQQSPQMSSVSSITGLSSTSSFNNFHRAAWCTPPRLFLEDQFDVVAPETGSVSSHGKKTMLEEPVKKKNHAPVKISPWTLARMNAEEVSKAAAEARKKSKVLQPVTRQEAQYTHETDSSYGSSGRRMVPRLDNSKKRTSKRIRLPAELSHDPLTTVPREAAEISKRHMMTDSFRNLASLQLEARGTYRASGSIMNSGVNVLSSPESSLDSPDIHPFGVSGTEEIRRLVGLSSASMNAQRETPLSRSTSDGYDASGGEDSDRVPPRIIPRSSNWTSILFGSEQETTARFDVSSSSEANFRK